MAFFDLGSPVDAHPEDHVINQPGEYLEWVEETRIGATAVVGAMKLDVEASTRDAVNAAFLEAGLASDDMIGIRGENPATDTGYKQLIAERTKTPEHTQFSGRGMPHDDILRMIKAARLAG
jgi:hypothetical protein